MNYSLRGFAVLLCLLFAGEAYAMHVDAHTRKRHGKALPKVHARPSIAKNFIPPKSIAVNKAKEIAFYKLCMYGETELERITYVLALNAKWRYSPLLGGGPEKIGYEVCLADALGLSRYENQEQIDAVKGTELMRVSAQFISFPNDKDNVIPFERQFSSPWARDYIEDFAEGLHKHLVKEMGGGKEDSNVPLLRMGSLVRSLVGQKKLPSTANCATQICSTHLRGPTIDISTNPKFVPEMAKDWIEQRLIKDRKLGKIVMIREKSHFHVFVIPPEFVE